MALARCRIFGRRAFKGGGLIWSLLAPVFDLGARELCYVGIGVAAKRLLVLECFGRIDIREDLRGELVLLRILAIGPAYRIEKSGIPGTQKAFDFSYLRPQAINIDLWSSFYLWRKGSRYLGSLLYEEIIYDHWALSNHYPVVSYFPSASWSTRARSLSSFTICFFNEASHVR